MNVIQNNVLLADCSEMVKKSLAIDQEGALGTNVRTIGPEEIHSPSRSKYMWAYEPNKKYHMLRSGTVLLNISYALETARREASLLFIF